MKIQWVIIFIVLLFPFSVLMTSCEEEEEYEDNCPRRYTYNSCRDNSECGLGWECKKKSNCKRGICEKKKW